MTENSADFKNSKQVNLEGAMAYFNDSVIRPFVFPDDFLNNSEYIAAAASGNVVEFFLKWLINRHNEQTQPFQHFRLGNVTVADPNNYIARSSTDYASTFETIKSKLIGTDLGGYLCVRYEADATYIDYLSEFTLTNTQEIVFGENLLDLKSKVSGVKTYSAIIPIGADIETESEDGEGNVKTTKTRLTIAGLPDGDITDDIVKSGDMIYSRSAVEAYGWICAPVRETTWNDVTEAANLRTKAVTALTGDLTMLGVTIDATALDLHFTDKQIQTFRIYRNVKVRSEPHGHSSVQQLLKLQLNLQQPQNTKITVGKAERSMTDINSQNKAETTLRIETAEKDIEENRSVTTEVQNRVITQSTEMANTASEIVAKALESYVEESNFAEFKKTLEAELKVWAGGISGRVTAAEDNITNVDGDLQNKFNMITKYFTFDIDGLLIGAVDEDGNPSPNKVVIDNDEITILVMNKPVQTFKADGTALVPTLTVTKQMNLVGLVVSEDETRINCDYVGV